MHITATQLSLAEFDGCSSGLTNSRPQYRTGGRGPRLGECGRAYGLRTSEEELVACSDDVVEQAKRRLCCGRCCWHRVPVETCEKNSLLYGLEGTHR